MPLTSQKNETLVFVCEICGSHPFEIRKISLLTAFSNQNSAILVSFVLNIKQKFYDQDRKPRY